MQTNKPALFNEIKPQKQPTWLIVKGKQQTFQALRQVPCWRVKMSHVKMYGNSYTIFAQSADTFTQENVDSAKEQQD